MTVVIQEPEVDGSSIKCEVTFPRRVRRFFTGEPFRAECDADISDVPPAIATIPVLAHVCPVAWTQGVDVRVPTVDTPFLASLAEIRDVLVRMYPEFIEGGAVYTDEAVDTREQRSAEEFDNAGMLFSGGVDSVASYIRHREADPTLVSVQGWVVGTEEEDRWDGAQRHIDAFAEEHGLEERSVRSNMLSFLDTPMLQAHFKRYVDGAWYSSVGHGLGLLGLCAPLSYALGLGTVHIAASHTAEFDEPWGSHPDIDDQVQWSHAGGNHDGYELSRQQKVELIADYARSQGRTFPVRTCTHSERGGNCNECEKCYRTMCGFVLAGLDPNDFGYEMGPGTFDEMRTALETGAFVMDEHTKFHWRDIKQHVVLDREFPIAGATEFFEWLQTVDVDAVADRGPDRVQNRAVHAVARNVPYPVYASLYPVYNTLKRRL